jgi:hypothetical protein
MSPPSAIETGASIATNSHDKPQEGVVPHEPGLTENQAIRKQEGIKFPFAPKFTDKYEERAFQKGRLALAFRIFAKLGFDEGVAGHITLRVRFSCKFYFEETEFASPLHKRWRREPVLGVL